MTELIESESKQKYIADFSYFKKEKEYLEIIYFQILRNSKAENFDRICFMNFTCFSEYLNSKLFRVLAKENKKKLKLNEFISGISLLFSLYFPLDSSETPISLIFDLISDNSNSVSYKSIREFSNNLLFDCMCKAAKYDFDFLIELTNNLFLVIKKTFKIGTLYSKQTEFSKRDFCLLLNENPVFLNIIVLLLNMLSPINEELVRKFLEQKNFKYFENDDFEDELEFEAEETPRVNSLPITEDIFDSKFSISNLESAAKKNKINKFEEKNNNLFRNNSFASNQYNSFLNAKFNLEISSIMSDRRRGSDCSTENNLANSLDKINNLSYNETLFKNEFDYLKDNNKNEYNINNVNFNNGVKKNRFSKFRKISELRQAEISTDNSDIVAAACTKNLNNSFDFRTNKNISPLKGRNYFFNEYSHNSDKLIYSKNNDLTNNFYFNRDIKNYIENRNFETSPRNNTCKYSSSAYENQKSCFFVKDKNLKNEKRDFVSSSNSKTFLVKKDLSILNSIDKSSGLYEGLYIILNELKNSISKVNFKFKALFRKKAASSYNNANEIIREKYIYLNKKEDIDENEKIIPFKIKFIGEDLVIYNSNATNYFKKAKTELSFVHHRQIEETLLNKLNQNQNAKYSVYFYTLKNFILPNYPSKNECEIQLVPEAAGKNAKYFKLQFFHIDQEYEFLFAQFEVLEEFYKALFNKLKEVERLFFLNNNNKSCSRKKKDNYYVIQRLKVFKQPQEKFSMLQELVESENNYSIKIQTLSKSYLDTGNYLFLKKLYDACKLNNFLKKNVFPINNIYCNHLFVVLEYAKENYLIEHEKEKNNYYVIVKKLCDSETLKEEVLKFKRLVKLLNKNEEVAILFDLFDF